ncbi:MAG: outer membrane beta-barrel protein [Planctomycetota bacterium]|jgi:hypothetical protein
MRRLTAALVAALLIPAVCGCSRPALEDGGADGTPGRNFSRGMSEVFVGGSTSFHYARNDQVDRMRSLNFTTRYGYFVTDRLEVMGAVGAEFQDVRYKTTGAPLEVARVKHQDYSATLGLQYNHDRGGSIVPFARGFAGVVKSRRETVQENIPLVGTAEARDETTAPFLGCRVGVRYFLTKRLSSDIGLGWKRVFYDDDFGGDSDDFSFTVGCALFF